MPTVARYGPRKVDTIALPGARVTAAETPESEGLAVAQAGLRQDETIGQVGAGAFRLGAEEAGKAAQEGRDYADTIADLNAKRQLGAWKNTAVYDPDTGALSKKGKDALGLPEQIRGEYDKTVSNIAAGLTNDRQRVRFQAYAVADGISLDQQINSHVASEMQRYGATELEGFLDNSRNRAILQASVPVPAGGQSTLPAMVGSELQQQEDAIRKVGGHLGMGPEQLQAAIATTRSKTHVGVIQNLLATEQTKAAQAYYDETVDQIDPDQRDRLAKALKEGHVRKDGQAASDKILAEGGTLTEQRNKAKAIDDPDVRDATLQYLEHEQAIRDHAAQEAEKAASKGAYNILDATNGDLTKIPPTTWQSFDGSLRSALEAYAEHKARRTPFVTNDATYYTLLKAAAETPQDFAKTNLLRYRPYLDDAAFNHVVGVQTAILSGNTKDLSKHLGPAKLQEDVINDALTLYGIDPKAKYDDAQGKKKAALQGMLREQVEILEAHTGKPVTAVDLQAMVDKLLSKGVDVPGSFWNLWGYNPMAKTSMPLLDVTVSDITSGQRAAIERTLKTLGRPISDATVLTFYQEYVARTGHPVPEK